MWRRSKAGLRPAFERRALILRDATGARVAPLAKVTVDLGTAVDGAEVVIIPLPAPAQTAMALALAPYLTDGQVIFAAPGTLGSYVMARTVREAGCDANLVFAESGTLPYLARKQGEIRVAITARATRLPSGVFPARETSRAFALLRAVFSAIEPREDALDAALTNAGPIIHPPLIVLNAGPIEHFGRWDIHNEGTQASGDTGFGKTGSGCPRRRAGGPPGGARVSAAAFPAARSLLGIG